MADPRNPTRRIVLRRLALLAWASAMVVACAKIAGIDGLEIGECKGGLCASEGGTEDRSTPPPDDSSVPPPDAPIIDGGNPCPSGTKGAVMVRVGTTANNFCIDESEVTVKQYADFVAAKAGDASGQPSKCAWNKDFAAAAGGANDDIPVAGIDWCDAREYCQWAGKRLCGKHKDGAFTGAIATADLGDFTTHEWLIACSSVGQLRYPYGGIQQPLACNTAENDAGRTLPVKSKTTCQGGFPGVYDMVGNLWEWYDGPCAPFDGGLDAASADAGPQRDECYVKGASFLNTGTQFDCRVDGRGAPRDRRGQDVGIRCCAD